MISFALLRERVLYFVLWQWRNASGIWISESPFCCCLPCFLIGLALICAFVIIWWITGQRNFMAIRNHLRAEQQTKQISQDQLR